MGEVEEDNNNKVLESKNAGFINEEEEETRKRLKDILGIDLKRVPTDGDYRMAYLEILITSSSHFFPKVLMQNILVIAFMKFL
jgi:hypothetical protein